MRGTVYDQSADRHGLLASTERVDCMSLALVFIDGLASWDSFAECEYLETMHKVGRKKARSVDKVA